MSYKQWSWMFAGLAVVYVVCVESLNGWSFADATWYVPALALLFMAGIELMLWHDPSREPTTAETVCNAVACCILFGYLVVEVVLNGRPLDLGILIPFFIVLAAGELIRSWNSTWG